MRCCVIGCETFKKSLEYISFHGLFCKGEYMQDWLDAIEALNGQHINKKHSKHWKICSDHFESKYVLNYGSHNRISHGAVPTIFPKSVKELTKKPRIEDNKHESVGNIEAGKTFCRRQEKYEMTTEDFGNLDDELKADIEFKENLIAAIKNYPCLYVVDHPDNNNVQQKKLAWIIVSKNLQISVTDCMSKWFELLQNFLHRYSLEKSNIKCDEAQIWPHYESLKEIVLFLPESQDDLMEIELPFNCAKPTTDHRNLLLHELALNRSKLLASETTIEDSQKIWAQIAGKLNTLSHSVDMPVIKWQKFWKDMKKNVGELRSRIRTKIQEIGPLLGTQIDVAKYSDEDLKILEFCGKSPNYSQASIRKALSEGFEFWFERDCTFKKCKKCPEYWCDLSSDYCTSCRSKKNCDICSVDDKRELIVYQVKNWSTFAKELLIPENLRSYKEIAMCVTCSDDYKKYATRNWKTCRVCAKYEQPLENLFSHPNAQMLKTFKIATNIAFNESDGLPGFICKVCKIEMQQFNNFFVKFSRYNTQHLLIHAAHFIGKGQYPMVETISTIKNEKTEEKKSTTIHRNSKRLTEDTSPKAKVTILNSANKMKVSAIRQPLPGSTVLMKSPVKSSPDMGEPPAKRMRKIIPADLQKTHPPKKTTGLKYRTSTQTTSTVVSKSALQYSNRGTAQESAVTPMSPSKSQMPITPTEAGLMKNIKTFPPTTITAKNHCATVSIRKDLFDKCGNIPAMFPVSTDVSLNIEDKPIKYETIDNNVDSFDTNPLFLISFIEEEGQPKEMKSKEKDKLKMVNKPKENVNIRPEPKSQYPLRKLRLS